jgi:hypothetical protein
LDSLAERYGLLPGEVLARASTFDLWVFDISTSYRKLQHDRQKDPLAGYDTKALAETIKQKRVKHEHDQRQEEVD